MYSVEIGTVEILRQRVYCLPRSEAIVPPGVYPLLAESDGTIRWMMRGRRSTYVPGQFEIIDDEGLSVYKPAGDRPRGRVIDVPSRSFTHDEFREFLNTDPCVREGDPEQQLRVTLKIEL